MATKRFASVGMSAQSLICNWFYLTPCEQARKQFESGFDNKIALDIYDVLFEAISKLGSRPIECTTLERTDKGYFVPYNFILKNKKTLSIKTNYGAAMLCPRVVGQCGFKVFNDFFSDLAGKKIEDQYDIRKLVYEKIHLMLPTFIDYLFLADYTIWLYNTNDGFKYLIIDKSQSVQLDLDRNKFTFTRDLIEWTESTNLKYNGKTIANIQTHLNRSFKFRFNMRNLLDLLVTNKITTETLGITAEKTICDKFKLEYPESFLRRYSREMQLELTPIVDDAFEYLPDAIRHTGSDKGERGGESKCSYDFVLKGNDTLSLKTNTGKMVCPPEVGQPGEDTCYLYFKNYVIEDHIDGDIYKNMVLTRIEEIFPIFVEHLFDSDFLLWIYKKTKGFDYRIFEKGFADGITFEKSKFSFTKNTIEDWAVSNTLKYDGISIGEFEVHKTRDCYKFRFNLENFSKLIDNLRK